MDNYYRRLKDTLCMAQLVRSLCVAPDIAGEEALFLNGKLIDSTCAFEKREDNLEDPICLPPTLVMFGAGHIASALYKIAEIVGLKTVVFDDRKEYCSKERFMNAQRNVLPFSDIDLEKHHFDNPYFIIFTHGHKADGICIRKALKNGSSYIGMIGSKKKIAATWNELEHEGFDRKELEKVHSPIGLEIKAATAEEIAVAIMAEIICTYRGEKDSIEADLAILKALCELKEEAVLCRIIKKTGSGPARKGAEMLVTSTKCIASIGGGALEEEAKRKALDLLSSKGKTIISDFDLTDKGALGMACGGQASVMFKYLSPCSVIR